MKGSPARSTRAWAEIGAATRISWPARRMAPANGTSGPKWPAPEVEANRTRIYPVPDDGGHRVIPGRCQRCRCSISSPRAISTSWTSSGANSPWSITPGRRRQPGRERGRVADLAAVVRDRPAVGAERDVAQLGLAEQRQRRGDPERQQLERHRWHDRVDDLVARGDHDEAVGRRRDDLLARVRAAAALDEPEVGRDLIGAVDRDVEAGELLERLDHEPERACGDLGGNRRGDAAQSQPALRQRRQQVRDGRARAEADPAPVLDERSRRLGRDTLLGGGVSHRR